MDDFESRNFLWLLMNLVKIFQVTNEEVAEFLCTVYIYHASLSWQWKLIIISELTKGMQHTKLRQWIMYEANMNPGHEMVRCLCF